MTRTLTAPAYRFTDHDIQLGEYTQPYALRIRDLPREEKPREKLLAVGRHQTIAETCETMRLHIERSRRNLHASGVVDMHSPLLQLLDELERSIEVTLQTQAQAANFLKYYQQ
jgi:hypothetical protein